ncbi:MAG TPA: 4-(cytidine 5'-diphospho)-2-C-methyl-D-erythritol kinase [Candidatus Binatia bacterium]|nr:4-(cytidine 5'-diphospho)-2-C-methyl-D-erythritol kinase [Candidatus Binatia bacterium]
MGGRLHLAVPAHAKLNLHLRVVGVRPDGHHDLETRFQSISLHDLLLVDSAPETSLEGGFANDLVLKAANALSEAAGRPLPARFRLVKRIPAGAGLGGGSSDAAATLRALSRLHRLEVDLGPVAAAVGADVPFFLAGGALDGTGRGEHLEPERGACGWFSLAWPGFAVSTAQVFRTWDRVGGDGENELTKAATRAEPRLAAFASRLNETCEGWRMTGAGSAFFRPAATHEEAEAAVARLDCWTAVARPVGAWGTA